MPVCASPTRVKALHEGLLTITADLHPIQDKWAIRRRGEFAREWVARHSVALLIAHGTSSPSAHSASGIDPR